MNNVPFILLRRKKIISGTKDKGKNAFRKP